jgi:hypothetical protein
MPAPQTAAEFHDLVCDFWAWFRGYAHVNPTCPFVAEFLDPDRGFSERFRDAAGARLLDPEELAALARRREVIGTQAVGVLAGCLNAFHLTGDEPGDHVYRMAANAVKVVDWAHRHAANPARHPPPPKKGSPAGLKVRTDPAHPPAPEVVDEPDEVDGDAG